MRWLQLLLLLTSACATHVVREDTAKEGGVAGMPWVAGTESAVREWIRTTANARDLSIDLAHDVPYVETALPPSSPVSRVGFFFRREAWMVQAEVLWLKKSEPAPERGAEAGRLWGMPLYATPEPNEFYAPDAHLIIRRTDSGFVFPERPRVELPRNVLVKTPTRTFHRDHLYAVVDGRIWFKRNPAHEGTEREPWRLFGEGVPVPRDPAAPFEKPGAIVSLSADGDDLLAIDDRERAYLCTTASKSMTSVDGWSDGWGFPGKRPLFFDGRAAGARSIALGRRAEHALYFEDAIGNPHHYGPMGTTTLHVLHRDGAEILFTDNGLPNDFSRGLCGPDDGRFIAESLSASASALFLIDRYGRLLTRFDDYDLNGGTPNFEYTYRSEIRADDQGDAFFTSQKPYYLPLPPWRWHAPPVLSGAARLSRDITILQTGVGNAARELRIAGLNEAGASGYYTKGIEEESWRFVPRDDLNIPPERLLLPEEVGQGAQEYFRTLGKIEHSNLPRGRSYRGLWTGTLSTRAEDGSMQAMPGVKVRMDWNPYCPPARLAFETTSSRFELPLHTVDMWTPMKRGRPGFDGTPLLLLGTLVFDDEVLTDTRPDVRRVVSQLRRYHHALFAFVVAFDRGGAEVRTLEDGPGAVQPIALQFGAVEEGWDPPEPPSSTGSLARRDLLSLADAPALIVDPERASREELSQALAQNVELRDELRERVAEYQAQLKALDEFRSSIRFAAPMLPLGRFGILEKLLRVQQFEGTLVLMDAEEKWTALEATLNGRIEAYEAALKRR